MEASLGSAEVSFRTRALTKYHVTSALLTSWLYAESPDNIGTLSCDILNRT